MNFTQIKEQIDKNNARIQQLMSPDIFVLNNEIAEDLQDDFLAYIEDNNLGDD